MSNSKRLVKKRLKEDKKFRWSAGSMIFFVVFVLYTVCLIFPYVWMIMNSLKEKYEYMENVIALPKSWLFSNYIRAFTVLEVDDTSFFELIFNSLWLALSRPTIQILTQTMASYVIAKYKFFGRNAIYATMIVLMAIPIYGSGASQLLMYKNLNLYDNPLFLVTSVTGLGGSLMIIAAFKGVSKTYMEAAFLEGAGHLKIFWMIMVPQISGLLSALWVMAFVGCWNDYMTSLVYLPSYLTLSTGLYVYQKMYERKLDTPMVFAGAVICMIPVLILFIVFQDKFINVSFGGGIKE